MKNYKMVFGDVASVGCGYFLTPIVRTQEGLDWTNNFRNAWPREDSCVRHDSHVNLLTG